MTQLSRRTLFAAVQLTAMAGFARASDAKSDENGTRPERIAPMRTVKVKDVVIGEGRPKVIVPVTAKTIEQAIAHARHLATVEGIDLVEFRVDHLGYALDAGKVASATKSVAGAVGRPVLVTFRTKSEGGETAINDEAYAALYDTVLRSGHADLIDVELMRAGSHMRPVLESARRFGVPVVMSNHDFAGTPPVPEIIARLQRMQAIGADILKIAAMPRDAGDVLKLMNATWEMHSQHTDRPLITISMAGPGLISRLSGEVFGSAATFGMVGHNSAPGQIEVSQLRPTLDLIHQQLQSA